MYGLLVPAGGGEPLPLLKTKVVVGRHADCDIVIEAKSVSGQHCRLEFVDGAWRVIDLDSRNGTGVDGRRCRQARIMPGQVLNVAKRRFHIDYPSPGDQPASEDEFALQFLQGSDSDADRRHDGSTAIVPSRREDPGPPLPLGVEPTNSASGPLGMLLPTGGGVPLPLPAENLVLGRSRKCDVRINSGTISSQHCRLRLVSGYWVVEDLGSSNGIRVDGVRYREKCVMPGSELSLARESFILDYVPGDGVPPVVHEPHSAAGSGSRQDKRSLLERAGLSAQDVQSIYEDDNAIPPRRTYSLNDDDM